MMTKPATLKEQRGPKGMRKGGSDLGDNWNNLIFSIGITNKVFHLFYQRRH